MAIIALLAVSSDLVAQVSPASPRLWVAGGLGVGTTDDAGPSVVFDLSYQRGPHLLAVRATGLLTFAGGDISDSARDVGLLYGRASTGRGSVEHASAAVGLALVEVHQPGPPTGPRMGIGIPVSVEGSANTRFVGLGVKGFANLNTIEPFAGVVLFLKLGRLR